jgi:microsomal dipeptidase-like Zn-dependent dipeptidase
METGVFDTAGELYKTATICDMTLPFGEGLVGREDALERFLRSGITFVSLTVGSDWAGTGVTVHNVADVQAMVRARSDRMIIARNVNDIRIAKQLGKLAIGFHFQGKHVQVSRSRHEHAIEPSMQNLPLSGYFWEAERQR